MTGNTRSRRYVDKSGADDRATVAKSGQERRLATPLSCNGRGSEGIGQRQDSAGAGARPERLGRGFEQSKFVDAVVDDARVADRWPIGEFVSSNDAPNPRAGLAHPLLAKGLRLGLARWTGFSGRTRGFRDGHGVFGTDTGFSGRTGFRDGQVFETDRFSGRTGFRDGQRIGFSGRTGGLRDG